MIKRDNRPKIVIADDHRLVADVCKSLLDSEFNVVAIVGDGHSLVQTAINLKPDVALIDISMPILNGLDAGQQIRALVRSVRLVYLTMYQDIDLVAEAFRRGASGYLLKTCAAAELVLAIRTVLRGGSYLSSSIARDSVEYLVRSERHMASERDRLSHREQEVLQLLAQGKSMKEISTVLGISVRTVAFHKYRMLDTLHINNTVELIQYAIRHRVAAA